MYEHDIIKNIISKYSFVNDDVYVDNENNMYKIDGFQLSYTFDFMDFYDLGWKSVTATVSDIYSRGGSPKVLLSSLGINKEYIPKIEEMIKGIKDASDYYNILYVGGDLNSSKVDGWIDTVIIGKTICSNSAKSVKEGDNIIITNPIGYTSLVFISFLNDWKIPISYIEKNKIRHPIVNKRIMDVFSRYCTYIHYSTDISDGLVVSLYNIIDRTTKGIKLFEIPLSNYVLNKAQKYGISWKDLLKYSGEEFESLLIVDRNMVDEILDFMKYVGFSPIIIGEIIGGNVLKFKEETLEKTGWDNFAGWF